uniref:Uncharacterized protein n=1 Tax=viral metagenome TaxID=1070528 RepID=A0A6C0LFE3_9ZZZZ
MLDKMPKLCTPAYLYFIISMIGLVILAIQNLGNTNTYTIGSFSTLVPNTLFIFFLKLVYIAFWTWVLNYLCKSGFVGVSWFLFLIPFIMFFVLIGMMLVTGKSTTKTNT